MINALIVEQATAESLHGYIKVKFIFHKINKKMMHIKKELLFPLYLLRKMVFANPFPKPFIIQEREEPILKYEQERSLFGHKVKVPSRKGCFWILVFSGLILLIAYLVKELIQ